MDFAGKSIRERGKKNVIKIVPNVSLISKNDLSTYYTPGIAAVSKKIAENKNEVFNLTIKRNSVAVVSDGSAVLGLGNIGPEAALPVMEGKSLLFSEFAGIDAFPICLATQKSAEIIQSVKNIAPAFGGINLEDISAPRCFEIENALLNIGIPVMHDDQHGTAVVVLAGLINALKVVGKKIEDCKIVISGAGAAGTAVAKMTLRYAEDVIPVKTGIQDSNLLLVDSRWSLPRTPMWGGNDKKESGSLKIIVLDRVGAIYIGRRNTSPEKLELAKLTKNKEEGDLEKVIIGADIFIGVSAPNILSAKMVRSMNGQAIIFAMANPIPEIDPKIAKKAGAMVVATGRSDYPNQINNVLAFPGIFRGALDAKATMITQSMKMAAALALSSYIKKPKSDNIIPSALDRKVVKVVSRAVTEAAVADNVIRSKQC